MKRNPMPPEGGRIELSEELTELLAEGERLLKLKASFGRMPNSRMREKALREIDFWFENGGSWTKAGKDQCLISYQSLRELWEAYSSVTRAVIQEGCDGSVIQRLEGDKSDLTIDDNPF